MLFEIQPTSTPPPAKTPETAQAIYDLLIAYNGNVSTVYALNLGYPFRWIEAVYDEAKELEATMIAYVIANPGCTGGQAAAAITSDWLDVVAVGLDVIKYNPTYDPTRTFAEFKAAMIE